MDEVIEWLRSFTSDSTPEEEMAKRAADRIDSLEEALLRMRYIINDALSEEGGDQ